MPRMRSGEHGQAAAAYDRNGTGSSAGNWRWRAKAAAATAAQLDAPEAGEEALTRRSHAERRPRLAAR